MLKNYSSIEHVTFILNESFFTQKLHLSPLKFFEKKFKFFEKKKVMVKIILENILDIEHYARVARDNDTFVFNRDMVTPPNVLRLMHHMNKDKKAIFINDEFFR